MREIFFRGKDIKGNWHIGLLSHIGNAWYISNKAGVATAFEVIPSTIGQFTGYADKNGQRIYEGDIVKERNRVYEIKVRNGTWVIYNEKARTTYEKWDFLNTFAPKVEIIGTIHDNPELLKGGADNGN